MRPTLPSFSDDHRPDPLMERLTRSRTVAWSALALALAVLVARF
jgi:hypothetical protein